MRVGSASSAPYFAEGVYERARAQKAKLEAYNLASKEEPKVLAKAIHSHYAKHDLVKLLKGVLAEMSTKEKGEQCFSLGAPTNLYLTQYGFALVNNRLGRHGCYQGKRLEPVRDQVPVGEGGTSAECRTRIDAKLAEIAESPDKFALAVSNVAGGKRAVKSLKTRTNWFKRLFHRT